jgi:hypothetical protein
MVPEQVVQGSVADSRRETGEGHARLTALLVGLVWAEVLWTAARHARGDLSPGIMALGGLGAQLMFCAFEAFVAGMVWRAQDRPVAWSALFTRVLAASACEAFAVAIVTGRVPMAQPLALLLCGMRASAGAWITSGFGRAFAAMGLLTLMRILLSAQAQARLARVPLMRGLWVVGSLHLAARLVMWWGSDLLQGRSFQP